ncbi:uncharacterized protein DS421_2g35690 [Arachis hypogaea]|nr:uncharacterized protein DS421_2g35690 [Arachis hypogaea]
MIILESFDTTPSFQCSIKVICETFSGVFTPETDEYMVDPSTGLDGGREEEEEECTSVIIADSSVDFDCDAIVKSMNMVFLRALVGMCRVSGSYPQICGKYRHSI